MESAAHHSKKFRSHIHPTAIITIVSKNWHIDKRIDQLTSNQLATTAPPLESPSDEKTEIYILNLSHQNGLPTQRVTIDKFKLNVFIDSESTLNIINDKVFNSIVPTAKLKSSKATIYPYQATAALSLPGKFIAAVQSQDQRMLTTFHVVKENGISI